MYVFFRFFQKIVLQKRIQNMLVMNYFIFVNYIWEYIALHSAVPGAIWTKWRVEVSSNIFWRLMISSRINFLVRLIPVLCNIDQVREAKHFKISFVLTVVVCWTLITLGRKKIYWVLFRRNNMFSGQNTRFSLILSAVPVKSKQGGINPMKIKSISKTPPLLKKILNTKTKTLKDILKII